MNILKLVLIIAMISSCISTSRKFISPQELSSCMPLKDSSRIPVVFAPGFKGSELFRGNEQIWLTPLQGLGLSTPDLTLQKEDDVRAGAALRELTLAFGLIRFKIYSDWLDFLESQKNWEPYVFTYDWRKDNNQSAKDLIAFLECIQTRHNGKKVHVVGHSNGGNLTLSAMNQRTDLFASATIVGAPMRGGIGFMEDLIPGLPTGLNSQITSPCVSASFVSPYTFFPRKNPLDTQELLWDEKNIPISIDFFKAEDWKKFQLGAFHEKSSCKEKSLVEFQNVLDLGLKFKNSLDYVKSQKYPRILVVYGENLPTLGSLKGVSKNGNWSWDFQNKKMISGDGRVASRNAQLPEEFVYEKFLTTYEHSQILNDKSVQTQIQKWIEK
jgi:pimeloyl-ACP methyl ester carboxylesterase